MDQNEILITGLYYAAMDARKWNGSLEQIYPLVNANRAGLLIRERITDENGVIHPSGQSPIYSEAISSRTNAGALSCGLLSSTQVFHQHRVYAGQTRCPCQSSPAFKAHLARRGMYLQRHVEREFEAFLKCGRLEHGFLLVRCESCSNEQLVNSVANLGGSGTGAQATCQPYSLSRCIRAEQ